MRKKGWSSEFEDPADLPDGHQLMTLEDAGNYITKLPKAEHMAPEWQQILMFVASRGWPTMLARIGVLRLSIGMSGASTRKRRLKRDERKSNETPPARGRAEAVPNRRVFLWAQAVSRHGFLRFAPRLRASYRTCCPGYNGTCHPDARRAASHQGFCCLPC
jgi:hypothetical protein